MSRVVATFSVSADLARGDARTAAFREGDRLTLETGLEHVARWNSDGQCYDVHQLPFTPPERPWNMSENRPTRRSPDWKRFPSRATTLDRLVVEAQALAPHQWVSANDIPNDPASYVVDLQAALDAQYGRGHYWAYRHGHRISVQCRFPVTNAVNQTATLDRDKVRP